MHEREFQPDLDIYCDDFMLLSISFFDSVPGPEELQKTLLFMLRQQLLCLHAEAKRVADRIDENGRATRNTKREMSARAMMAQKYPEVVIANARTINLERPFRLPNGNSTRHLVCFMDRDEQKAYCSGFTSDHTAPEFLVPIPIGKGFPADNEIGPLITQVIEKPLTA